MSRFSPRRMVPDRLAPFVLLASGRPESAAARLGVVPDASDIDEVERLRHQVLELEGEVESLRKELGAALEYFDRNLKSVEDQLALDGSA